MTLYERAIDFARGDSVKHLGDLTERDKDIAELGVRRFVAFMRRESASFDAALEEADEEARRDGYRQQESVMDVPDDIRETALKCIADYWGPEAHISLDDAIAAALVDERERCAKIAEKTHAPFTALAIRSGNRRA